MRSPACACSACRPPRSAPAHLFHLLCTRCPPQYAWTFTPVGTAGNIITAKSTGPSLTSAPGALASATACEPQLRMHACLTLCRRLQTPPLQRCSAPEPTPHPNNVQTTHASRACAARWPARHPTPCGLQPSTAACSCASLAPRPAAPTAPRLAPAAAAGQLPGCSARHRSPAPATVANAPARPAARRAARPASRQAPAAAATRLPPHAARRPRPAAATARRAWRARQAGRRPARHHRPPRRPQSWRPTRTSSGAWRSYWSRSAPTRWAGVP